MSESDLPLQIIDRISIFENERTAISFLNELLLKNKPCILSFINAHAFNLCLKDSDFAQALIHSDLLLRDGYGMELLFKSIGKSPGINLNGTDFIPLLVSSFLEKKIALIGTNNPYLTDTAITLSNLGHQVVVKENGFLPLASYLPVLKLKEPEIIILGMGMPIQEKLSMLLKANLNHPCIIINGGAIIDFYGKRFTRAPLWMRDMNIEWVYRLLLEPKRLGYRYIVGNYVFLARMRKLRKQFNK